MNRFYRRFNVGRMVVGVTPELPFDKRLRLLIKSNLSLVSLKDVAFLRLNHPNAEGGTYSVRKNGTYTKGFALFWGDDPVIFLGILR